MFVNELGQKEKRKKTWKREHCWIWFLSQTCQIPIRPITPGSLLESICWSVSEPTSNATLYTDSFSNEDVTEHPAFFYAKDGKDTEASFANLTRSLTERLLISFPLGQPKRIILYYFSFLVLILLPLTTSNLWHACSQWKNRIGIQKHFSYHIVSCWSICWDGAIFKNIFQWYWLYMLAGVRWNICILPGKF